MMRLSDRERGIAALTVGVGLLFVLDHWILAPLWERARRLERQITRKETQLAQDRHALQERKEIEQDYLTLVHSRPKDDFQGMNALLGEIASVARLSSVKILDVKPSSAQRGRSGSLQREAAVAVVTESDWEPLARFAYQIHQSPQLLQIDHVSLHRKSDDSDLLQAQWTIAQLSHGGTLFENEAVEGIWP